MADARKEPTAAEAMLFFSIVKHTRNKADVDWEAVATEAGFKNADVAKVRFGQVKRKLGISTDTSAPPRAPATPTKKGTASKVAKTPRSKGKGRGKVKKEESKSEYEDDDQKPAESATKDEHMEPDELATDGLTPDGLPSDEFAPNVTVPSLLF
ncbi:hypothetical protein FDECE_11399 [Fusarium decemcellulare]|nr:hypothetical protein FDECE_11399 [Fusarium decemcellulare]